MNNTLDTGRCPKSGHLVVGRLSSTLRAVLRELVRLAKRSGPMAPVTVVAPSRYASLNLRQELGREGFANVKFIEMPVLAELLGAANLGGRRPLTSILASIYLRQILADTPGLLTQFRDHSSTQARIRSSFRELRGLDDGILAALETQRDILGEVASLYRKFRNTVSSEWYDVEDLTAAATDAVHRSAAPGLPDLGQIIFYLPRSLAPAENSLVEALAQRDSCAVILGYTGDANADGPVRAMTAALTAPLGEPQMADESTAELPLHPGEVHLHVAPDTHQELRWVIRQVVKEAGERETPFHRMAILYRMENPYGILVRDELRLAGLPLAGPSRDSLADTAVGRTLAGLLEIAGGDFSRAGVMAWLTGCPVQPPREIRAHFNPSRWETITRQAGIVGGVDQWKDRLGHHAKQLAEDANRREAAEEITEARADRMREEAAASESVLEFIERLAEDVTPPAAGSQWTVYCDWASRLLDMYLSPNIPEVEVTARDRIGRAMEELRGADRIRPSTTLEEFTQTVADSMRAAVGHLGVTGQGVFVAPFSAAAGMSFDVVWLVGMIEGCTPPPPAPDPLLPEHHWQAAGGPPHPERHVAAERYDYLSAVSSAPRRYLSYPVSDAASQRQAHPSRWFLEQASALEGATVHTSGLAELNGRPWLSRDLSAEHALTTIPDQALADVHDYDLSRLLQWRGAGQRLGKHPLAQQGILRRSNRQGRSRYLHRLTEFDGNLSQLAAGGGFGGVFEGSSVSPTSLETWASCPYRYFLGNVLRLSALENPDEIVAISPMERGSLIHAILERFVTETQADGATADPSLPWRDEDHLKLMEIAEVTFAEAEARGVTGKPLLWNLVKQDIRDDLTTFLEEDSRLRAGQNTGRSMPEVRFGLGGDTPEVSDGATGLHFRGVIDRLDISPDEASALVIDYKTGSNYSYRRLNDDPIDQGKRLQLGVYSLAAKILVPSATRVRAAYWFTTTKGEFRFYPREYFDIEDPETARRFRYGVSAAVDGIRGGVFPANPGSPDRGKPANCQFCDFDSVCPSRRVDIWERKKTDPLLTAYRKLAGDLTDAEEGGR